MTFNTADSQHHHALTGLVLCEKCNISMSSISEPEPCYICPNRIRG